MIDDSLLRLTRLIRGSVALIGIIFTGTRLPTDLSCATRQIHVISTTTYRPRSAFCCGSDVPLIYHTSQPLAPANGAAADATRDPLLRDKVHGQEILEVRKALAFAGFTHKSPRVISYVRADKAFDPEPDTYGKGEEERGRSTIRQSQEIGRGRAISM